MTNKTSTGNRSTGDCSTGDWSISDHSSGHFSTEDYSGFGSFNKTCTLEDWNAAEKPDFLFFDLTKWVKSSDMTEKEKRRDPSHEIKGGYLKVMDYKEAFQESYKNATDEDKALLLELPNFDPDVFFEISGIDVRVDDGKERKRLELIEKADELSRAANELLEKAKNL